MVGEPVLNPGQSKSCQYKNKKFLIEDLPIDTLYGNQEPNLNELVNEDSESKYKISEVHILSFLPDNIVEEQNKRQYNHRINKQDIVRDDGCPVRQRNHYQQRNQGYRNRNPEYQVRPILPERIYNDRQDNYR